MRYASPAIERAIERLSRLPGIGRKTAQRLVFYLLRAPQDQVRELAQSLLELKERVRYCSVCFNLSEEDPCPICTDPQRDRSVVCVVEQANDVVALERTGQYRGLYHVLGGALSPLDGIGPDDLRVSELVSRLEGGEIREVIVATNPNTEGEATAVYLARLLKPLGVRLTRIARGIPMGSDLEFADEATLARALEGRVDL
ncbi:MAG: recombination mediator RecR [candidate division KSB1 bacterium]|nr:recombination mediator RecR [candidate division KSB1 bacterium]